MERKLVKVLKGLAEFENMTLGRLVEKIARVYRLSYDAQAFRRFRDIEQAWEYATSENPRRGMWRDHALQRAVPPIR